MKIAIEGCAHGELETIYETIRNLEEKECIKVDLLICCGDFQASRNEEDLKCMAIPEKYTQMCSFYKYYSGEKTAPILTIFIGGNHEASNYLQELPYGGWVAPNIYYLGNAGVINIAGIRIAGISGIYKGRDFMKGHYEICPYNNDTKRSVYHVRNLEVFRLKQLSVPIDIFLSHDWPTGICDYGNKAQLIRFKPHFEEDIDTRSLGSQPNEELLNCLKPKYWFSGHLHCKFTALVPHDDGNFTKFLALDKCLPQRRFLQIINVPHDENLSMDISYDLEWLTILRLTNHLLSVKSYFNYMPGPTGSERFCFTPSEEEKSVTQAKFTSMLVPKNFVKTAGTYCSENPRNLRSVKQPDASVNPQTTSFCDKLSVDDPLRLILKSTSSYSRQSTNETSDESFLNSTFINETDNSLEVTPSPIKRFSLQLPDPVKCIDTEEKEDVSELQTSRTKMHSFNLPTVNEVEGHEVDQIGISLNISEINNLKCESKDVSLDVNKTSDFNYGKEISPSQKRKSPVVTTNEVNKDNSLPSVEVDTATIGLKKFKRRNASLYESEAL